MKNLKNDNSRTTEAATFSNAYNFPTACREMLESLKGMLVQAFSVEYLDLDAKLVRRAIDEADALASATPIPHLLLPALAEEKVRTARAWSDRQREVLERSALALAA